MTEEVKKNEVKDLKMLIQYALDEQKDLKQKLQMMEPIINFFYQQQDQSIQDAICNMIFTNERFTYQFERID